MIELLLLMLLVVCVLMSRSDDHRGSGSTFAQEAEPERRPPKPEPEPEPEPPTEPKEEGPRLRRFWGPWNPIKGAPACPDAEDYVVTRNCERTDGTGRCPADVFDRDTTRSIPCPPTGTLSTLESYRGWFDAMALSSSMADHEKLVSWGSAEDPGESPVVLVPIGMSEVTFRTGVWGSLPAVRLVQDTALLLNQWIGTLNGGLTLVVAFRCLDQERDSTLFRAGVNEGPAGSVRVFLDRYQAKELCVEAYHPDSDAILAYECETQGARIQRNRLNVLSMRWGHGQPMRVVLNHEPVQISNDTPCDLPSVKRTFTYVGGGSTMDVLEFAVFDDFLFDPRPIHVYLDEKYPETGPRDL